LKENFDIVDRDHIPKHGAGYVEVTATLADGTEYATDQEMVWDYSDGIDSYAWNDINWIRVKKEPQLENLTSAQILTMIDLQVKMNETVNPYWINANYPFLRAAHLEGGEAIEHHGWKWWKKQTPDMAQMQMELVDIWHFYISHQVVTKGKVVEELQSTPSVIEFDGSFYYPSEMELLDQLDLQIAMNATGRVSIHLFNSICDKCDLSRNELYRQYVGKNVLNMFRQANGYKEGTYDKIINGREDNEWLVALMDEFGDTLDAKKLYGAFEAIYKTRNAELSH